MEETLSYPCVLTFDLDDPSNEPDIASSCIDLSERLIHTHVQQFYAPAVRDPISLLFEFNLNCLETPEIIPKRCAANFWVKIQLSKLLSGIY